MVSNQEIYSTVDFNYWLDKQDLLPQEKFLIETYLNKNSKTVEAGTGGGRIVLEMQKLGFTYLSAFDYVPGFVEKVKQKDKANSISFSVEDATALNYKDCEFEQLVYLQQIICCVENDTSRLNALKEAYRILKKGGYAIFSFLNFEYRENNPSYMPYYLGYIRKIRELRNSNLPIQYLSRLKLGGKFNFGSLIDKPPYTYWYKVEEAYLSLKEANFEIVAIGSDVQIYQGKMHNSLESFKKEKIEGSLYFVCKK
jgi:ubiquinone/menaquinone biosynthesis C-methylase UbiE